MKFLLYIVGLRRSNGSKSGEFLYSAKHDKFIYQGRELDAAEFNVLMAKRWPLQHAANQQVSGLAFDPNDFAEADTTEPKFFEFPINPPADEPVADEESASAEDTPETEESEAKPTRTKKTK